MPEIVTLTEAKQFLRIENDDETEDATLQILIAAATESALEYADGFDQAATQIPARLKLAVLAHIAQAYGDREGGAGAPEGAGRLLHPFRDMEL